MKNKMIAIGLFLAPALSLPAADAPKVEIRADSVQTNAQTSTFTGAVVAVVGEMRISADQIVYDRSSGVLKCIGPTKIETPKGITTGTDATIDTKVNKISIRNSETRFEK